MGYTIPPTTLENRDFEKLVYIKKFFSFLYFLYLLYYTSFLTELVKKEKSMYTNFLRLYYNVFFPSKFKELLDLQRRLRRNHFWPQKSRRRYTITASSSYPSDSY